MKKYATLTHLLLLALFLVGCDAETVPVPTSTSLAAMDIPGIKPTPTSEPNVPPSSAPTLEPISESNPLVPGS